MKEVDTDREQRRTLPSPTASEVLGVLLAGGRSRRFGGGDKCLSAFAGRTLLDRVIARFHPQVARLLLNANGDAGRFARFDLPVTADTIPGFPGPLAGILAGLEWASAHAQDCPWVASAPIDTPFLPGDLILRLMAAVREQHSEAACAASNGRLHPVVGLWSVTLAPAIRAAMERDGLRAAAEWARRCRACVVDFPIAAVDPFFNVNLREDAERAERLLDAGGAAVRRRACGRWSGRYV